MTHARRLHSLSLLSAPARRQRGVVLLMILLVTLTVGGYFGVRALNIGVSRGSISVNEAEAILARSKEALLAWSISTDDSVAYGVVTGSAGVRSFRPGNLPYPDLYDAATLAQPADGIRDHGCARTTWTGTQALIPVTQSMSATNKTRIRCFGRLPMKTLGIDTSINTPADDSGRWPWYAVSANLVNISHDCPYRLDGTITTVGTLSTCLPTDSDNVTRLVFPWITVLDPSGAVISTRVAAVIMLPGPVTTRQPGNTRQVRSRTALPTAFLDTVDNTACAALAAGRCDNGRHNQSPGMTFIQCVDPLTTPGDARYSANYACNDRLVFITIDELMSLAAKRMEREFVNCLKEFASTHGQNYPWAATLTDPSSVAVNQVGPGNFPSNDESLNPTCPTVMNPSVERFANYWQGWQRDASYQVAADRKSATLRFNSLPGRSTVKVPSN